ncbi:hypothetical protein EOI86_18675 [Hwanghaeella grinnelliae]|uniref:Uncharacterized protein n=1 Tax=Hwanghaeella grinnelliae TaxID=2500179 RepID=A0A437QK35_9PROT|nr:hypothetical protein [Hwanghaeella grinnelliae]RVU34865.1 hypothetical protein EOI86_18675 [Hwanghaeella grinnelliae]
MDKLVSAFKAKLEPVLYSLRDQLLECHEGLTASVGFSSNSAFLLRAYVSVLKDTDGEEIAITADVRTVGDTIVIESDVVHEDGLIIADGPSTILNKDISPPKSQEKIDVWLRDFEKLFSDQATLIDSAIRDLK